jgi:glucokinase
MRTQEVPLNVLVDNAATATAPLLVVCDVGGTNTRVSLLSNFDGVAAIQFYKAKASSAAALVALLADVEKAVMSCVSQPIAAAAICVPGPVSGNFAVVANFEGETQDEKTVRLRDLPQSLFPERHTMLLNDLEAAAHGVLGLSEVGKFGAHFKPMFGPRASEDPTVSGSNALVVAPGTGLGTAALHHHRERGGTQSVMALEFGHTSVATKKERALLGAMEQTLRHDRRGLYDVEYDDVCTGRGLVYAYKHITRASYKQSNASIDAGQISQLAERGDKAALEAMHIYHRFIMMFSSQMVMGLQAETVVLCGDNVVKNKFYFDDPANVARAKEQLYAHSMQRLGFMARPTVMRQVVSLNLNLVGCVHASQQHAADRQKSRPMPMAKL